MRALSVYLGELEVGLLEHFDHDESEVFTFNENYIDAHIDTRPVLGQFFEDRLPKPISVGGPICWFDHLLPQGMMRRWRSLLLNVDESDGFSLLEHLGENLPGSVIMRPAAVSLGSDRPVIPSQPIETTSNQFRFSLAGAQWKLSARSSGRGLTTNANAEGVEYIAKFHSPEKCTRGAAPGYVVIGRWPWIRNWFMFGQGPNSLGVRARNVKSGPTAIPA